MGAPQFVAERFAFGKPASVDREKGIVRGVRIVNVESKNDRVYPEPVLRRDGPKIYSGLPVNVGHHYDPQTMMPVEVPPQNRFGRLSEAVTYTDGGLNAEYLQFNPKHPFAEPFLWACENDPTLYSFSPLHRVKWQPDRDAKRRLVAEALLEGASVDIVSDGGTTSTIFESRNWTLEMAAPDAQKIADSLESDGAWLAFLTDLFAKMGKLSQTTKDAIQGLVAGAMSAASAPADGADAAAAAPAMEALRRFGPVGKWAAGKIDALYVAEAAKKRSEWAANLIKSEAVAESLVTPLFVSMVAESFGNEAKAKEIIADRKALSAPAGNPARSSDRAGAKSVEDLVKQFEVG